ncbi:MULTISPECIES: helicase-related protein [unclassified Petrotoga]|uniref:helicase-related protein n=1 Tax=unclassified Petrotoga TaxID=2620614 RepID=UPI000CA00FE6|nr:MULTISPECIES: helicase-related protein [unclassified Petrotoga]PNR90305.1 helicase [Petrotoga sp. 9T1HF07.CasAA.8.2]PNR93009.1 helicase [Petrotoga sp. HWHPT.55.6.3]
MNKESDLYPSNNIHEFVKSMSDLTFITNAPNQTLKDRFEQLIKDCQSFDCLVAYFYISGFHLIYKWLEKTEKIKILIGIGTSKETYDLINTPGNQILSHSETKQEVEKMVESEMSDSEDNQNVEEGVQKFVEWIKDGKLEIKAYPSQNIHAKLYIMTFKEGDRDVGRVITGSSNFTQSGLLDNLEFNVELKNRSDYEFAKRQFEELWKEAVDVSEKYIQTISERTWLNQTITPYELYLKFLYEYFKEELSKSDEIFSQYFPENFKTFEYQKQAVINAKRILEEYGGVFISDVVGLGKTYISAMLAGQLDGRTLVIAPPALLNKNNPGSWQNVFSDFHLPANFVSIGKIDEAKRLIEQREYKNIIIDEAHRFRNEANINYEKIAEIARGKRVILVSATPYNNSPKDLLSLIKLFQNTKKSNIPGVTNLEEFFGRLEGKLKKVDRQKDYNKFLEITKSNAKEIREKVLKYLMVRRTRREIEKYFAEDLKKNKIKFPQVEDPKPFYYQLNDHEDSIFMESIRLITQEFKYARYTPLLYLKKGINSQQEQSQKNMVGFMKVLLVKRLESSFYSFKKSIERFIHYYEMFIKEYREGRVYISKKYINKIFELSEAEDDETIQKLIEEGKAEKYESKDFNPEFEKDLNKDLEILREIRTMWQSIKRDPKLETLLENLKNHNILKNKKIIIFTESKETAEYLSENINNSLGNIALVFHGNSPEAIKEIVIENFDARAKNQKDDYKILISTEVLSEGVNLHRSNIVINYDIPWNPTRLMQRVGRINRIDTPFNKIYTFNFFPTKQADSQIELTTIARSKIEAFLTLLGGDTSILTEGEPVSSHELFNKLLSKDTIEPEEEKESELKYLRLIEDIQKNNPELFEKVKQLPKKARSAKVLSEPLKDIALPQSLITFFRKGKLMKFYLSNTSKPAKETDFLTAAKIFESTPNEKRTNILTQHYYELLDKNKSTFYDATIEEIIVDTRQRGSKNEIELLKILKVTQKNAKQLTEEQEEYLDQIITKIEEGGIPKQTVKKTLTALNKISKEIQNPLKVIGVLQSEISPTFLKSHYAQTAAVTEGKREVILSLYLGEDNDE